jgi:hypothetical protein
MFVNTWESLNSWRGIYSVSVARSLEIILFCNCCLNPGKKPHYRFNSCLSVWSLIFGAFYCQMWKRLIKLFGKVCGWCILTIRTLFSWWMQCLQEPHKLALCGLDPGKLNRPDRLQDNFEPHLTNLLKVS